MPFGSRPGTKGSMRDEGACAAMSRGWKDNREKPSEVNKEVAGRVNTPKECVLHYRKRETGHDQKSEEN
jgi:hypothetical protein